MKKINLRKLQKTNREEKSVIGKKMMFLYKKNECLFGVTCTSKAKKIT